MSNRISKNQFLINWISVIFISLGMLLGGSVSALASSEPSSEPPDAADMSEEPVGVVRPALTLEEINSALESVVVLINEIGDLVKDFARLINEDPLNGIMALLEYIGQLLGLLDSGDGVDGPLTLPGPGLSNQAYPETDLFQPIGWINLDNGLPGIYSGRKPFGTNLGMMIDGYFFTLFAPDSGKGPGGFLFYDVSDPYQPTLVRRVYEPETRTALFREPHAFGLARINGRRYMAFQNTQGVEFWDFTDLNDLRRVGEIDLPGVNGGDYSNVSWQLTWQAPYVYVASSEQGIFIIDAGDPSDPVLAVRDGSNPIPVSELGGFRIGPIFTFGHQMVISSMQNRDGMASLDISDPVNPRLLDRIPDLEQFYYATCFNGKQVAVSVRGEEARMELYDLSDPAEFVLTDNELAVPGQLYCAFQDHYVFQGTEDRVHKIDLQDPSNPVDVGSGTMSGPLVRLVDHGQVSPLGNLVFVGNDHGTGSAFIPHSTEPDRNPPEVIITAPRADADNVNPSTGIGISFSDVLDFNSVNENTIQLIGPGGIPVAGIYSQQNGIVNIMPQAPLQPFSRYDIRVAGNGVRDVMGNAITDTFTASFTTGAGEQSLDVDVVMTEATVSSARVDADTTFDANIDLLLPGATYEWDFGDGTTLTGLADPSAEHVYAEPGHYSVTLTIRWQGRLRQVAFIKTVVPELTDEPPLKSSTAAQSEEFLFVVNPDNGTVTAVDKADFSVVWEVAAGNDPQTASLDVQGNLWVTARADDQLVTLDQQGEELQRITLPYGAKPHAVVCSGRTEFCWVSLAGSGQLLQLDLAGNVQHQLPLKDPRAIALSGDENTLWVTRFISPVAGAEIYQVALSAGQGGSGPYLQDKIRLAPDVTTTDSQDRARGLTNYLFDIAISPSGNEILVPGKKDNIYRGLFRDGQPLDHDKTVRAVAQRIAVDSQQVSEWDFDNRANPRAVAFSPLGDYVFVALQGSNKIAVMDVFSGSQRVEIETELAPQGLSVDAGQGLLFVHNFMSRSLQVFDISGVLDSSGFNIPAVATVALVAQEALAAEVLAGKQVFYNADDPRMSRESYFSCASCHVDGGHDGRVWDFTERGEGLRNTITLRGRGGMGHGNVHWTANFDEIQDFENDIRNGFGGTGFLSDADFQQTSDPLGAPKAGLSEELDALAGYVSSLISIDKSPYKASAGELDEASERGLQLFDSLNCRDCHTGSQYTDGINHSLPTLVPGSGSGIGQPLTEVGIETPTLAGVWHTAPYFHHGQAQTLLDVIKQPGHGNAQTLGESEQQDLVAYLRTLDGRGLNSLKQQQGFRIKNARWGCLSATAVEPGSVVQLQDCGTALAWTMDEYQRFRLLTNDQLCLTHNGKALYWSRVRLAPCSEDSRQQFDWRESGHIHWQGKQMFVLDGFGSSPGARVGSWWRHRGENQIWRRH